MPIPEKVLNQAARVAKPVSGADMAGRKDIRDWQMVTIDGEDAKDLDDAVSVTKQEDGSFRLGVHIADVTNYVQEYSALDVEALKASKDQSADIKKALDSAKESDAYLFGADEPFQNPVGATGGKPPMGNGKKLEDMSYEEYKAYRQGTDKKD